MLHVVPPMRAPRCVRESPLADASCARRRLEPAAQVVHRVSCIMFRHPVTVLDPTLIFDDVRVPQTLS